MLSTVQPGILWTDDWLFFVPYRYQTRQVLDLFFSGIHVNIFSSLWNFKMVEPGDLWVACWPYWSNSSGEL